MFSKLFGRGTTENTEEYREGQRLFLIGKEHGKRYEIDKALEFFDRSYAIHKHPAPLVDRGHMKMLRVRHFEAMQDLLEAQRLDSQIGEQLSREILPRLTKVKIMTEPYRNGMRETLIADRRKSGRGHVARKVLLTSFKVDPDMWEFAPRATPLMKFHFFNELDNLRKFESPGSYPDAQQYVDSYPVTFIDAQLQNCPSVPEYIATEMQLHTFLCSFDESDMRDLRSDILYLIHDALMSADYGLGAYGLTSDIETHGVIKEAHSYLNQ